MTSHTQQSSLRQYRDLAGVMMLPCSVLMLTLSYFFVEPLLVSKAKHWVADNQRKLVLILLGSELGVNEVVGPYVATL